MGKCFKKYNLPKQIQGEIKKNLNEIKNLNISNTESLIKNHPTKKTLKVKIPLVVNSSEHLRKKPNKPVLKNKKTLSQSRKEERIDLIHFIRSA